MKRSVSGVAAGLLGAACLIAASASASAQVGVYIGTPPPAYDPYYAYDDDYIYAPGPSVGIGIGVAPPVYAAPGPQVYGYVSTGPSTVVVDADEADRPSRAGGCGTYRYWDGNRCRDARNK